MSEFKVGDIITPQRAFGSGKGTYLSLNTNYPVVAITTHKRQEILIVRNEDDELKKRHGILDSINTNDPSLVYNIRDGYWAIKSMMAELVTRITGVCKDCINTCKTDGLNSCGFREIST